MSSLPPNKNPFLSVATWTPENLKDVEVKISDINETTSDFTRKKNPNNRHWKGIVTFKYKDYESRIIKMANCPVPFVKKTNYGRDYVYACLQKSVADAIVTAGMKADILIKQSDDKVSGSPEQWWATINNLAGRAGIVDGHGNFDPRDLDLILGKTEQGIMMNFDLVFSVRLTLNNKQDRSSRDAFHIVADCSRAAIKAVRQEVEPPSIDTQIPMQRATKADIASQELIDQIDALTM